MDRQVLVYINPLDGLVHVSHRCKGIRETIALPAPFWHLDEDGVLAPGCKLYCDPASGGCGLYLERVPLTGVPHRVESPAREGRLRRTLNSWRRKR